MIEKNIEEQIEYEITALVGWIRAAGHVGHRSRSLHVNARSR